MATAVFVDGPGLYHAALKDRVGRWLDLRAWTASILPGLTIGRIHYFSAWANPPFPNKVDRQRVYLRALATVPIVTVHMGRGRIDDRTVRTVGSRPSQVRVHVPRQKGVDVALATALLTESALRQCDTAVVVTADSDLRPALRAAREEFDVRLGIVNPLPGRRSMALREDADFHLRPAQTSYLAAQFPLTMSDQHGSFRAPKGWAQK
ncbi:MAG TPA: NYN domain-containing protein [Microlunatus sp.]|nr:NYN domain-containing protein [Microlunatus sp.]